MSGKVAWLSCPGVFSSAHSPKGFIERRTWGSPSVGVARQPARGGRAFTQPSPLHTTAQYRSPRPRGRRDDDTHSGGGARGGHRDGDSNSVGRGSDPLAGGRDDSASNGGIFGSPVVLEEGNRLMRDHAELLRLGQKYKLFDREGKLAYIAQMESVFDRWKVFLKRFELSADFQAQLYLKQLDAWLSQFGMRREDLLRNLEVSLDMMRQEAEREL
ncbi:hypothetical protein CCYA_CCYA10G2907 [Cyanidiococcus yangmingshanensis]|uniref:Uncharacterized protein n=1 Tax=Cyanidiococcus yangmingshanensis TaxID=2690220 RepID=A0A7J7IIE4_9RHOD|nr:hypothetical protein F1559_003487 [Cyanidiococcus yangmingshanensis]KAK4532050.1 hypothetical protein CCYA_CCYA10G2907 [Cyanidiococcus yangmingshanensis]